MHCITLQLIVVTQAQIDNMTDNRAKRNLVVLRRFMYC